MSDKGLSIDDVAVVSRDTVILEIRPGKLVLKTGDFVEVKLGGLP